MVSAQELGGRPRIISAVELFKPLLRDSKAADPGCRAGTSFGMGGGGGGVFTPKLHGIPSGKVWSPQAYSARVNALVNITRRSRLKGRSILPHLAQVLERSIDEDAVDMEVATPNSTLSLASDVLEWDAHPARCTSPA